MMINNNSTVTLAYNNLSATNKAMEKTARALSTGLRAATAADDASGFAMGINMSAQISGLERAIRNSQDGISLLQTAEGGLSQINSMLQRMRELSVQAANDTLTTQDRSYLQKEIGELRQSIDNIANNTTFNSKRLLDGSSSAIWSSDVSSTKLRINGAVTMIDSYGQRKTADGNYRIEIHGRAGQAQVQKSAPMLVSRKDVAMNKTIDTSTGLHSLSIYDVPTGNYTITGEPPESAEASLTNSYGLSTEELGEILSASVDDEALTSNASILFEVTNTTTSTITLRATSRVLNTDGTTENYTQGNIVLGNSDSLDLSELLGADTQEGAFELSLTEEASVRFEIGYKFVYNLTTGDTSGADRTITIANESTEQKYSLNADLIMNREVHFRSFYLDEGSGHVYDSETILATDNEKPLAEQATYAEFEAASYGQIAENDVKLRDIASFWDKQGVFLFNQPQKITITQGNGLQADVMIYGDDTIEDLRSKLNDAIAEGLGQGLYTDNRENFVSFVRDGDEQLGGSETVAGTLVVRSAVAGSAGSLSFTSDNNDLINALGLNTIQEAKENTFVASVYDAHSGSIIADNIETTGNVIRGVIVPNVDIEFDSMANIQASWDENTRSYIMSSEAGSYTTVVHIADRSTAFQVGQSVGHDMFINIGDMRTSSLGLNRVDISTRAKASASISVLDAAIRKVSIQRTKVGSYQNELEYNYNTLTETNLHMQESESRLKDTDMAKEMMEFVKLQILSNTGSSMLSQANQNSQAVMNMLNM